MAASVDLPTEIIEDILARLPRNTPLSPLSLISRSWLACVSKLLNPRFSRIHLHYGSMTTFLRLLQSPFCSFLPHVRQLYLHWGRGGMPPSAQEILVTILSNPRTGAGLPPARPNNLKSTFLRTKECIVNSRTPTAQECHMLNVVCLFPCLEHLQIELATLTSNIPTFSAHRRVSSTLKSLSVICNSTPPNFLKTVSRDWKHFLKWVRSCEMYTIKCLYLTDMRSWDYYGGAETLVKLQGTSLQHLHFGPRSHNSWLLDGIPPPLGRMKLGDSINLSSLQFDISSFRISQAAAEVISIIPPKNIVFIGLDMSYSLIYDVSAREHLNRLAKALQTRGFGKLRRIRVRLEFEFGGFPFEPTVQALRDVFPEKLLSVENLPHARSSVRHLTDECYQPSSKMP